MPAGGGNIPQGPAGPCPAAHGDAARPRGGRERPPYIAAENGRRPVNGRRFKARTAGRCKHRPLRRSVRRPGECGDREGPCPMFCRVYGGREDAATRKGICRAGCGTPPPPAATPPLAGEAFGGGRTERLPCKGSWMRQKAQTEGCIAGWQWKYPARSGSALPRSARRFHKAPRRARSPALHCGRKRAATRKRQPSSRPDDGPMQASAPAQGRAAARRVRRPGRVFAGSGHPSVACGDTSPYRRGFRGRQRTKRRPCKGSLSSSSLLKAASPVKGRRWRRLPYPSTVTSVRRTWPASQASRSRMQGAGRLPAVRSTRP